MTVPPVELGLADPESPLEDVMEGEEEQDYSGLLDFLREEERLALDDTLNGERANALDFYNGELYGDEEEGRSQATTRDVAEVVDYATTSLLRVMISGDNAVEFTCSQKEIAQQITAAVGQEFFEGQNGYRVLHDWVKAGLLEKTSICKVCVEEQQPKRREAVVSAEQLIGLQQQVKLIAASQMDAQGTQWAVAWAEEQPPKFRDYVVPNEESYVSFDARDLDDDCQYLQYRMQRTVSQIAEMGYDVSGIESESYNDTQNELASARDSGQRSTWPMDHRTGPNRTVWLLEEYARYDLNGDGITELLMVHRVGDHILAADPIDEQPGVIWGPFPMPGRLVGQSLADKVMDIQRIRSVLLRQALDNIYQSNAPRVAIFESSIGENTIDDLLTVRAASVVRLAGNAPVMPMTVPFMAESAFQFMEVLAGEKESRTGITRLNQGLDADAINKTASGTAMMQASGQQIEDYMVRNLAEAFAQLMMKKYRLMKQFGKPMMVSIDGEDVQTDPRQWPDDANIRVRVGLGTGRKDQRLQYRMNLLQIAQQAMAGGLRIFTEENIFNQVAGVIEDSSLGNVAEFVTDPQKLPPAQDKPDPDMLKAQSDAMLQAEKIKGDQQKAQGDMMLQARKQESDHALSQQQLEYDLQAKREKAGIEADLARQKAEFEAGLAQQTADREYALAVAKMQQERELRQMEAKAPDLPQDRPGGSLAE